ncbi:putative metalloprotease CJM1_0395 family protein [Spirochaetota bacterium]
MPGISGISHMASAYTSKLAMIDNHIRTHERAHAMMIGGTPQYSYVIGPEGELYAVGGSVAVDLSTVPGDPEATIRKARNIRIAALAPADPSPQDLKIAAAALRMEMQAKMELEKLEKKEAEKKDSSDRLPFTFGVDMYV